MRIEARIGARLGKLRRAAERRVLDRMRRRQAGFDDAADPFAAEARLPALIPADARSRDVIKNR